MKVSTNARNAVNCIIDLAMHQDQLVSVPTMARRQSISVVYLEQIFSRLRRAGLVSAVRGCGGGYRLARDISSISVADILYAVEERVDMTSCMGSQDCRAGNKCLSHDVWSRLNTTIHQYLQNVQINDLVEPGEAVHPPVPS